MALWLLAPDVMWTGHRRLECHARQDIAYFTSVGSTQHGSRRRPDRFLDVCGGACLLYDEELKRAVAPMIKILGHRYGRSRSKNIFLKIQDIFLKNHVFCLIFQKSYFGEPKRLGAGRGWFSG